MKTISKLNPLALALAGAAAFFAGPSMAFDLTGKGWVQYGDAQSYSLPVLALQYCPQPNKCEFKVDSTPGAIKGLTVIGTGSDGQGVNENVPGTDNAYETPNGVKNSDPYWNPTPQNYSNKNTDGDSINNNDNDTAGALGSNTWDTSLLSLKKLLTGSGTLEDMIFFFNNNQIKSGNTFAESLAAWAQIKVRGKTDGSLLGTNDPGDVLGIFDLTNRGKTGDPGGAYKTVGEGGGGVTMGDVGNYTSSGAGPVVGNRASTDYVLSGGQLCIVLDATQTPSLTDTNGDLVACGGPGVSPPIDHNLGADQAAYAILFPELNDLLKTLFNLSDAVLASYTMSVDVRLGCDPSTGLTQADAICAGNETNGYGRNLNNGYEQIFISTASNVVEVPEPGTLLLTGLALVGLAGLRRRAA